MNDRYQLSTDGSGSFLVPKAPNPKAFNNAYQDGTSGLCASGKVVIPKEEGSVSDNNAEDSGHKKSDPPEMSPSVGHEKPGPSGAVRLLPIEPSPAQLHA